MVNMLALDIVHQKMELSEALPYGAGVLIRGMCTVFAVLCIIWLVLVLVRIVLEKFTGSQSEKKKAPDVQAAPVTPAAAPVAPSAADAELVAVIAAAIAAATEENGGGKFRVVSFHRVNK